LAARYHLMLRLNLTRQPIHEVCQRKTICRWTSFSATNASPERSKARLHQTQHPKALPASWRCLPRRSGSAKAGLGQPGTLLGALSPWAHGSLSIMDATRPAMSASGSPCTGSPVKHLGECRARIPAPATCRQQARSGENPQAPHRPYGLPRFFDGTVISAPPPLCALCTLCG